jgi:hypothetical protein
MRTQASERLRITEDGFPADIFVRRVDRTESFSDTGVNSGEIGREDERGFHVLVVAGIDRPRFVTPLESNRSSQFDSLSTSRTSVMVTTPRLQAAIDCKADSYHSRRSSSVQSSMPRNAL